MCLQRPIPSIPLFLLITLATIDTRVSADGSPWVNFDMPMTAAALTSDQSDTVTVDFRLSALLAGPDVVGSERPPVSQWMIRVMPRDAAIKIADYAPRTTTASDLATPIRVKSTAEESQSAGIAADGGYGPLTHANLGADRSSKETNTYEFDRISPVQAVTAAGTIERGRGVFFKMRWTATQVLEGEKTFSITMSVPEHWRGGMIDVSVVARSAVRGDRKLNPWDSDWNVIGKADFVVTAYRSGDIEAEQLADQVARAEAALRELASKSEPKTVPTTLPSMLKQVAVTLDLHPRRSKRFDYIWLRRVLQGSADPHMDKQLRTLPMSVRVAVLDYVDLRDQFSELAESTSREVVAAKPPL